MNEEKPVKKVTRKTPGEKKVVPLEKWEQEQFFRWVYANQIKYPELQLCNGSMNGVFISSPKIRANLKAQGLRPGFPDIDLPVRRWPYAGLRIELKRQVGGVVSEDQKRIHKLLAIQGQRIEVCRGWLEAVDVVIDYLGLSIAQTGQKNDRTIPPRDD